VKEVNIRKCEKDDISKIIKIEKESFEHPYKDEIFYYFLKNENFFVAEFKDDVIGYIMADIREGQGLIISVAVAPDQRRKGIGRKLMEKVIDNMNTDTVKLTLRTHNINAFRFYNRLGFHVKGFIRDYYENGDDAIVMEKDI